MRKVIFIFLIFIAKSAIADDLSANQIHEEIVGQSIAWWDSTGWIGGNLILLPSGKAVINVESPQPSRDSGSWSINGNQVCTFWKSLRQGQEKCYSLREIEPGHFVTSGGNEFKIQSAGV
jgi:hypothetical protein